MSAQLSERATPTPNDLGSVTTLDEKALVGSLLWLRGPELESVRAMFTRDDLADPRHQVVLDLIDACIAADIPTDPATAVHVARTTGLVSGYRLGQLGTLLLELHGATAHPRWAHIYATAVLEASTRRAIQRSAQRLEQAAAVDDFTDALATVTDQVHALAGCIGRIKQGARE